MVTVRDVAMRAGVSVGTVSRVLSKNETVKQPLKERVLSAVDELGYKPNLSARALRTNRIDVIGFVVPDITNPFFAQLAKCVEIETAKRDHSVMLANTHDDAETEKKQITALADRSPRGVIVVAASDECSPGFDSEIAIVSLDRRFQNYSLISADHLDGSTKAADHLFDLGHRQIAYIAGPQTTEVGRLRKNGFVSRISTLNSEQDPITLKVIDGQFDYESGERIGRDLLNAEQGWRPTAVAAANDQLAIGVLRAARDLGVDVPSQLSIVGFDDIELANLVVPRLTTIRQRTDLLAKAAVEQVFLETVERGDMKLPCEMIIRETTSGPA